MSLLDKIRKARESKVEIGKLTFTIMRPTDYQAVSKLSGTPALEVLKDFVVDWSGINEIDLIPGGQPEPVAFDADIFAEWLQDNLDVWPDLVDAISNAYKDYNKKKDDELGKQKTG